MSAPYILQKVKQLNQRFITNGFRVNVIFYFINHFVNLEKLSS